MSQFQNEQLQIDQKNGQIIDRSKTHLYACFQQPQTINILKYLQMPNSNTLFFDSGSKNQYSKTNNQNVQLNKQNKNSKKFKFSKIYDRDEKFKYAFSNQITKIIQKIFQGYSQTVFIYGTDQFKKDKLLIGQSQNAGLLLTSIAGIFQYCHQNQLQDEVTIKISCSMFKNGQFTDPFNSIQSMNEMNQQNQQNSSFQQKSHKNYQINNIICDDKIQQRYLLGSPQIIIRNMKTAMKIINLISKRIQQRRQLKQQNTQNLIFTVKLQIDKAVDKYTQQVYQYNIPKLYIVKLGNPSVVNTLNGVNKNNQWFINFYNYLQTNSINQKNNINQQNKNNDIFSSASATDKQINEILTGLGLDIKKNEQKYVQDKDPFTNYIKDVVLNGVADIHSFVSIDNKMTSNQCLTAFIFNNYLLSYHTKPKKISININTLNRQKLNYQQQLMSLFTFQQNQKIRQIQINEKFKKKYNIDSPFQNQKDIIGRYGTLVNDIKKKKNNIMSIYINNNSMNIHSNNNRQNSINSISIYKKNPININNSSAQNQQYFTKQTLRNLIINNSNYDINIFWQIKIYFLQYIQLINDFMECFNRMEYQYANVLSNGCDKLSKYIFNEEIQQFFYAKKIPLNYSNQLYQSFQLLKNKKNKLSELQQKIIKKINFFLKKVAFQLQSIKTINGRQQFQDLFRIKKQKILTLIKLKQILTQLFKLYNTMSFHFIYQDNIKLKQTLQKIKTQFQDQFSQIIGKDKIKINYDQIIKNIKNSIDNSQKINQKKQQTIQVNNNKQISDQQKQNNQRISSKNSFKDKIQLNSRTVSLPTYDNKIIQPSKDILRKSIQKQTKLIKQKLLKFKSKKQQNQLDKMFMNSNVGIRSQFNKTSYYK